MSLGVSCFTTGPIWEAPIWSKRFPERTSFNRLWHPLTRSRVLAGVCNCNFWHKEYGVVAENGSPVNYILIYYIISRYFCNYLNRISTIGKSTSQAPHHISDGLWRLVAHDLIVRLRHDQSTLKSNKNESQKSTRSTSKASAVLSLWSGFLRAKVDQTDRKCKNPRHVHALQRGLCHTRAELDGTIITKPWPAAWIGCKESKGIKSTWHITHSYQKNVQQNRQILRITPDQSWAKQLIARHWDLLELQVMPANLRIPNGNGFNEVPVLSISRSALAPSWTLGTSAQKTRKKTNVTELGSWKMEMKLLLLTHSVKCPWSGAPVWCHSSQAPKHEVVHTSMWWSQWFNKTILQERQTNENSKVCEDPLMRKQSHLQGLQVFIQTTSCSNVSQFDVSPLLRFIVMTAIFNAHMLLSKKLQKAMRVDVETSLPTWRVPHRGWQHRRSRSDSGSGSMCPTWQPQMKHFSPQMKLWMFNVFNVFNVFCLLCLTFSFCQNERLLRLTLPRLVQTFHQATLCCEALARVTGWDTSLKRTIQTSNGFSALVSQVVSQSLFPGRQGSLLIALAVRTWVRETNSDRCPLFSRQKLPP